MLSLCAVLQVKQLLPHPRIIGRTFPICQLDVDGVQIEISSMHTRTPFKMSSTPAAAAAAGAGGISSGAVPPDAAQILQAGPKAAAVAAAAAAAMAAGQVRVAISFWC
jgi:hypothetical protein